MGPEKRGPQGHSLPWPLGRGGGGAEERRVCSDGARCGPCDMGCLWHGHSGQAELPGRISQKLGGGGELVQDPQGSRWELWGGWKGSAPARGAGRGMGCPPQPAFRFPSIPLAEPPFPCAERHPFLGPKMCPSHRGDSQVPFLTHLLRVSLCSAGLLPGGPQVLTLCHRPSGNWGTEMGRHRAEAAGAERRVLEPRLPGADGGSQRSKGWPEWLPP